MYLNKFSPLQVENKPHGEDSEQVFILGTYLVQLPSILGKEGSLNFLY
jgi:hypothetical protein